MIGTMGFWFAGLYQDWLSGVDALMIGAAVAAVAPVGDLFESMLKRDLGTQGHRHALRPPRRPPRPPRRRLLHDRRRLLPAVARLLSCVRVTRPARCTARSAVPSYPLSHEEGPHTRLDRVDRHAGAGGDRRTRTSCRSSASRPARLGDGASSRRASTASRRSPWPTPRRRSGPAAQWSGRVLAGEEGIARADRLLRRRPGPQRDRRRRRARLDDRRAQRGDRRRPRQQGEPGARRRAGDGAGRGDRARGCCRSTPSTRPSSS